MIQHKLIYREVFFRHFHANHCAIKNGKREREVAQWGEESFTQWKNCENKQYDLSIWIINTNRV